jgi:nicotinamidase-related amidase
MTTPPSSSSVSDANWPRRQFLSASAALAAAGFAQTGTAEDKAPTTVDLRAFQKRRIGKDETLAADKTALIIIDMMNRFCDPKWMSGGDPAGAKRVAAKLAGIIPSIQSALESFRQAGGLVVHVVNAKWTESGREVVKYQRGRDYGLFDSREMSVIDELKPREDEIIIRKVASSAFTGTGLDFLLNNAGIENVVLAGQFGTACVFYSLIQSREFGFANYWLDDGILYGGGDEYEQVFEALVGSMWAKLASAQEIARALTA